MAGVLAMTGLAERRDARASYAPTLRHDELGAHPTATEARVAAAFLLATFILRVVYIFHYRIDSDEPQHLHVVWGWVHGLVQYRDVFDNHAPLFHLFSAPLVALIGDRPDILALLRCGVIGLN